MTYKDYCNEAKELLAISREKQMKIAALALKVCDITWGGKKSEEHITLRKFAKDIGLSRKTLEQWVCIKKRVYDHLDPAQQKNYSYEEIHSIFKKTKATDNLKKIQLIAKQIKNRTPAEIKFEKYLKHIKTILYNSERPQNLEFVSNSILIQILNASNSISRNLTQYLNSKDRNIKYKKHQQNIYNQIINKYKKETLSD